MPIIVIVIWLAVNVSILNNVYVASMANNGGGNGNGVSAAIIKRNGINGWRIYQQRNIGIKA